MPQARSTGDDVDIDMGALFASLGRNWRRIAVGTLLVTLAAFVLLSVISPRYRAETRILIEARESVFTKPAAEQGDGGPILDQEAIKSQVELIASPDNLRRVAGKLNLATNAELSAAIEPSALKRLMISVGIAKAPDADTRQDYIVQAMRDRLLVYSVQESRVVVVQFSSKSPQLAADIANAIADEYIAMQQASKSDANADATGWLQPEIDDLSKRVREAEAKVAAYRSSSDLLIGQNNAVLATQQLSELSSELSRVKANRAAVEARAEGVRAALAKGAAPETLPDVIASPLIQRLRERQVQLNNDIADLSATLLSGHPRIRALRSQLADLNGQIRQEARKVLASLENEAETARLRDAELTRALNQLKAQASRAGEEEVELRALEREAAAQRQLLESYLTRYREASSRTDRGYTPADARIFSRADRPLEPYFPKVVPMTAATFIVSLLLLCIATLLHALFSGAALRPAPVSSGGTKVRPELQDHPAAALAPEPAVTAVAPPAAIAEPTPEPVNQPVPLPAVDHSNIADAASRLMESGAARAVVLSPEGDEASALTILLVRELADRGVKVVLIDMTGSGEIGRSMLDDASLPGITNLLVSEKHFSDVIHHDNYSEAEVIPLGDHDPMQAMQAAGRLPMILGALQSAYDLVIIDAGEASVAELKPLLAEGTEIVFSIVDPDHKVIGDMVADMHRVAMPDPILLAPFEAARLEAKAGRIDVSTP
ncbi:Wzz/FepE/Etk N-terminal domain-containing protein [Phyllobacterium sp. 0TCS1.6C]|uniref:GumC family protein n=1 Tax=unclassified Phyllobacterium TaxID=2638441 RepID=UPI002264D168|nr:MULTISPECIES: Wzz/FepE/Etk N-terminal domain-containing protein [unclassified Phyllobacterium]MCX8280390.1 Wzz/FepE/Etk N-terminal domain-containing protein [Phyllobacterium sp. 0TCS1.6C]MCX8295161.1 Wzz/FepE/Etk N-terminal domain-containing protein [Phyllobacterium sp. 0TCS1.6A]